MVGVRRQSMERDKAKRRAPAYLRAERRNAARHAARLRALKGGA